MTVRKIFPTYQQLLAQRGTCSGCNFTGILTLVRRPVLPKPPEVAPAAVVDLSEPVKTENVRLCGTCLATLIGVVSENLKHRRLPEGEYRQ